MTLTEPPDPLAADPVRTTTAPELPDAAVPLLNNSEPDVPDEAAFEVATVMEPVVALLLPPAMIDTEPPTCPTEEVVPADKTIPPPEPLFPAPTKILMLPPLPPVAKPEESVIAPALPAAVLPVNKTAAPLVPLNTALADDSDTEPVELLELPPLTTDTLPPTCAEAVAKPPAITTEPPVRPLETPAVSETAPPIPLLPAPTTSAIFPP